MKFLSKLFSNLLVKLEAPREPVAAMNVSPEELDSILYGKQHDR